MGSTQHLQGTTITAPLSSILNINTGSLAISSYSGTVDDPTIAMFVKARKQSSADVNPGIKTLKVARRLDTEELQGGIQNVLFTVDVTK